MHGALQAFCNEDVYKQHMQTYDAAYHIRSLNIKHSEIRLTLDVSVKELESAVKCLWSWFISGDNLTGALQDVVLTVAVRTAPTVSTTSTILSSNEIQNGYILVLVLAN